MGVIATGPMFELALDDGIAHIRVWKRPDISRQEGVRNAQEMTDLVTSLAIGSTDAAGVVLDVREAPVAGPLTQRSIEKMMANSETAGKRIAVLISSDPLHVLQMKRIVATGAPSQGRIFDDPEQARAWARGTG